MRSLSNGERRERAVTAALEIGAAHGIGSDAPVVLKDSNNTVVHRAPEAREAAEYHLSRLRGLD